MPGLKPLGQILQSRPVLHPQSTITLTKDVTYATVRSAAQKIDLYAPASAAKLTILHVHGGAWTSTVATKDDPPIVKGYPRTLAGFGGALVADMEYPLIPVASGNTDTDYRQQMIDAVLAAVSWLRTNAATYNGSTSRIVAWGESAGGHLALMAGIQGVAGTTRPDMVMALSAAGVKMDVTPNDATIKNYLGITTDNSTGAGQTTARQYSPYYQWTQAGPPVYLLCDVNDPLIDITLCRDLHTQIGSVGGTVTKVETTKGIHADFNAQPELVTAYRACFATLAA